MNLFKIANIKIKINWLVIVIAVIFSLIGYIGEIAIIFVCVLAHELSHAILAERRGFQISEIEIFPFGGIARLDTMLGCDRKNEIFIAAIGPLSNLIILLVFLIIKNYCTDNDMIRFIVQLNFTMFTLNLLPVFPLDGGRILRAFLSEIVGYKNATRSLSYITYFIAFFLIIYSVINVSYQINKIAFLILSAFLIIAAKKEVNMAAIVFSKDLLLWRKKILDKRIMKVYMIVGLRTVTASEIIESFLPRHYHMIIIIDEEGKIVGELGENKIIEGIIKYGMGITLEELLFNDKKW